MLISINFAGSWGPTSDAEGECFTFVHGKYTGERVVVEGCDARPIPLNTVVSHGRSCRVTLPPHSGFRVIVSAFQSCYAGALSASDASELRRLGFVWNYVDEGIPSMAGDCTMPNAVLRESLNDETASHEKGKSRVDTKCLLSTTEC